MASSSVSQESLDYDDFDIAARRSRIRALRARTTSQHKNESTESAELGPMDGAEGETTLGIAPLPNMEHESPTRMANRLKDKRGRPNHLHKGKTAKDKRKLREKRRSTGVVHMPSTESTGDSLDEDSVETRRNTSYNEVIDADNPQTPEEDRRGYAPRSRNKSPSDLEADLEDNQDYDSTVSQSETNLTLIGQASPIPVSQTRGVRMQPIPDSTTARFSNSSSSQKEVDFCRPVSYPSRYKDQDFDLERLGPRESGVIRASFAPPKGTESNGETVCRSPREKYQKPVHGHFHHHHHHLATESHLAIKNRELERLLESERKENKQLKDMLEERESRIAELEMEISLLNKDLDVADEDNDKLKQENGALLRAIASLNLIDNVL